MKKTNHPDRGQSELEQSGSIRNEASDNKEPLYEKIKLGVDVHAMTYVAARMIENQNPQPARTPWVQA